MLVHFTANTFVRGEPVQVGQVMDVPEAELWRLDGRYVPAATKPESIESRDPEPEQRDPQPKRKAKA